MISNRCRWTSYARFTNLSPRHWLKKYQPKKQGLIKDCACFAWVLNLTRWVTRGALTRRFFRNLEIPRSRPRLRQAAGKSHAGWRRSSSWENRSTIFGSTSGCVSGRQVQAGMRFLLCSCGDFRAGSCAFLTRSRSRFNSNNWTLRLAAALMTTARRVSVAVERRCWIELIWTPNKIKWTLKNWAQITLHVCHGNERKFKLGRFARYIKICNLRAKHAGSAYHGLS